jgi:sporulation protein YlmC with PRC-barrel domain
VQTPAGVAVAVRAIPVALLLVLSVRLIEAQAEERTVWSNDGRSVASSDLVGAPVRNAEGESVGRVDALLVDPPGGNVSYAVVVLEPLPSLTQRRVVVPWTDIRLQVEQEQIRKAPPRGRIVARGEQAALDRAPRYER